jgi:two-component system NtrC family response regulator
MELDYSPSMQKPRLLIVDDDESIRSQMRWALIEEYEVLTAEDRPSALEVHRKEHPTVATLDLGLPPKPAETEEGFQALAEILETSPGTKVIVITGQDDKKNALRAIGMGAYDFFCKPIKIDELKIVLTRAFYLSQLEAENRLLQDRLQGDSFEGMMGTRAIHRLSARKKGPFIPINCGAIPENLLESELFGHEKGSFTGAHIQRKGRVESAQGGTLFLDEIGELSPALQVKLLRYLQEQKIERVGGREEISVDARVMAATNRNLQKAMKAGKFREDLYYRLGVVVVSLPPLREREGDILLLATFFLHRFTEESKRKINGFSKTAVRSLESYPWPGNIREMENRIRRAVIMAEGVKITPRDLELETLPGRQEAKTLKDAREETEREIVQEALHRNNGNRSRAAEELGVSRPTLYELMDKLGISRGKEGGGE